MFASDRKSATFMSLSGLMGNLELGPSFMYSRLMGGSEYVDALILRYIIYPSMSQLIKGFSKSSEFLTGIVSLIFVHCLFLVDLDNIAFSRKSMLLCHIVLFSMTEKNFAHAR